MLRYLEITFLLLQHEQWGTAMPGNILRVVGTLEGVFETYAL